MRFLKLNPFYFIDQGFAHNFFDASQYNRVIEVALPFLNLYQPLAQVTGIGLGVVKSSKHLSDLAVHLQTHEWKAGSKDVIFLAVSVISVTGKIFHFRFALLLNLTEELINDVCIIYQTVKKREYEECVLALLKICQRSVYLISVIAPTPQILLISAITQTVFKIIESAKEFENGRYFEGTASLILSIFYGYQCRKKIGLYSRPSTLAPQEPAQILTDDEVALLIQKFEVYKQEHLLHGVSFKSFLKENNYSTHLANSNFSQSIESTIFTYVYFDSVIFTNCEFRDVDFRRSVFYQAIFNNCRFDNALFEYCKIGYSFFNRSDFNKSLFYYSDFVESDFINCKLNECLIKKTKFESNNFKDSRWKECTVKSSNFEDALLVYGQFESTKIIKTNLSYANFYGSKFKDTILDNCRLTGTCFLDVQAKETKLLNCDLADCLLLNAKDQIELSACTKNIVGRPVIGISSNYDERGTTNPFLFKSLKEVGAIPVKFDAFPSIVDPVKLHSEVGVLLHLASVDNFNSRSLPQYILDSVQNETGPFPSEIKKLHSFAQHLIQYSDAIFIPGGLDVEPDFYGAVRNKLTVSENDCRRTLVEFSLFREAKRLNTPIIGICRGAQVGAIYHGGYLKQHVKSEYGVQDYWVEKGTLQTLLGNKITGLSMHHQAIVHPGNDLVVTVKNDKVIKALEHPQHPLFLFQFHIEVDEFDDYFFSNKEDHEIIMSYLFSIADNYRIKKIKNKEL